MKKKMVPNIRHVSGKAVFMVLLLGILILSGCATPVGVGYLDPQESHHKLTANVLTGSTLSAPTMQMLNRTVLRRDSRPIRPR